MTRQGGEEDERGRKRESNEPITTHHFPLNLPVTVCISRESRCILIPILASCTVQIPSRHHPPINLLPSSQSDTKHKPNPPPAPTQETASIIPRHHQSLTFAPIPLPLYQTLSLHRPTLIPTFASASTFNSPFKAFLTASCPTLPRSHATGSLGVSLTPGGTSNGRS